MIAVIKSNGNANDENIYILTLTLSQILCPLDRENDRPITKHYNVLRVFFLLFKKIYS